MRWRTTSPAGSSDVAPEPEGREERIPAHAASVGGLPVRRALPTRARRMAGPWCFLDHVGPSVLADGQTLRVAPHPHIGLQTFTWMIEGEVLHRDSLGSVQVIRPGQVNLMTAGRGIAHSEELLPGSPRLHMAQLWIALPDAKRAIEPSFEHHPVLPVIETEGARITVLAGSHDGERAPGTFHSPLVGLDLSARAGAQVSLPLDRSFEHVLLALDGDVTVGDEPLAPGVLAFFTPGRAQVAFRCTSEARLLLVGGRPFGEDVLLWWNFVARRPDEVVRAAAEWNAGDGAFGRVSGYDGEPLRAPDPAVAGLRR
ncbi:MAG: pirin family protein [Betaproteobacteria bacterium]|nr:pirin family protein [Betaproteobacteria bacterium]